MSFTITISLASESKIAPLTTSSTRLPVACGEKLEGTRGALRRFHETLPLPIFADRVEEIAEDALQLLDALAPEAIALQR